MNLKAKPKIINLMPHGPAYHFSPGERPDVFWEKPDGSILGFWKREWPDLLGKAVLEQTDRYEWEVWQPDFLADRIYSQKLETGVTHLLFPVEKKISGPGIKRELKFFSEDIFSYFDKLEKSPFILQLHGFDMPFFYKNLINLLKTKKHFPAFLTGHGMYINPLSEMSGMHRPLTYLDLIILHHYSKNLFKHIDIVCLQNDQSISEIKSIYNRRIVKCTMGCDFDFWAPVPSADRKRSIRNNLGIPEGKKVFFTSSNFIPLKQIDKLLEVFNRLQYRKDFYLIIAGHGDKAFTDEIDSLAEPLTVQRKAALFPYVTGEILRELYWASDIYVSASSIEGGSVAIMKAMACGLPILTTEVGETTERMKKHGAGMFMPLTDYDEWDHVILEILDNQIPKALDIEIAREAYDWPQVAKRFLVVYDDLVSSYYGIKF